MSQLTVPCRSYRRPLNRRLDRRGPELERRQGADSGTVDPIAAGPAECHPAQRKSPRSLRTEHRAGMCIGVPNVTLLGTSMLTADQATASVDYDVTRTDRLSFKYYYQNDPVAKPFGFSQTGGFPVGQNNGSQVGAIDNTIAIGSRLNWEQRAGLRPHGFLQPSTSQTLANSGWGPRVWHRHRTRRLYTRAFCPGLLVKDFAVDSLSSGQLRPRRSARTARSSNMGYLPEPPQSLDQRDLRLGQAHHRRRRRLQLYAVEHRQQPQRLRAGRSTKTTSDSFLEGIGAAARASLRASTRSAATTTPIATTAPTRFDGYLQDKWQIVAEPQHHRRRALRLPRRPDREIRQHVQLRSLSVQRDRKRPRPASPSTTPALSSPATTSIDPTVGRRATPP